MKRRKYFGTHHLLLRYFPMYSLHCFDNFIYFFTSWHRHLNLFGLQRTLHLFLNSVPLISMLFLFPTVCLYQFDVHVGALSANNHIIHYLRIIIVVHSRCRPWGHCPLYPPFMIRRKFVSTDRIFFYYMLWQNHERRQEYRMKHNFKKC